VYLDIRYETYRSQYDIDSTFGFYGVGIRLYGDGDIVAGRNSYIGRYSRIQAGADATVCIGEECHIAQNVTMYSKSNLADQDFSEPEHKSYTADIIVGDYVWIGNGVFITPGTEVGKNTVIGANSVVTRDIPPHSIAVGTPAKVTKFKSYLSDERRTELAEAYAEALTDELKDDIL
jgi:acetyltransferase-like isoleucine patch superfamily enzyme